MSTIDLNDLNDLAAAIGQLTLRFRLRRGLAATWTSTDPVLLAAELGVETDTGKAKLGDGTTAWTALPYWPSGGSLTAGAGIDIVAGVVNNAGVITVTAGSNISIDDTDPQNIVISATGGGGGGGGMTQLAQVVTTSGQTSFTLMSSIANTYRQLKIVFEGGSTSSNSSNSDSLLVQFNGDTGADYRSIGNGCYPTASFFFGANGSSSMNVGLLCSNGSSAPEVTYVEMDVVNYAQSANSVRSVFKGASWQGNIGEIAFTGACTWAPTTLAEVTSIVLSISANAFTAGSTATLYGID